MEIHGSITTELPGELGGLAANDQGTGGPRTGNDPEPKRGVVKLHKTMGK